MRTALILPVALLALTLLGPAPAAAGARLKELVTLEGVRDNQLIGYGLVVGLNKTGDRLQTVFSAQSLTNLLQRMGVSVPPDAIRVNNTASVMVTATLPPFAQPGTRIDVTAAAIGDASSLQGGLLLLTSLRASDGQVYAVAQGPVVTGGFVAGRTGTSATVNHPTVGRVPNGAIVERVAPSVTPEQTVRLQLRNADFTTAARISEVINKALGAGEGNLAVAESSAVVSVNLPAEYAHRSPAFIARIESLEVDADRTARVVINERTGTIVMGKQVKISPVVVLHGNLTVEIETGFVVSQPAPLSPQGQTTVVPETSVGIREEQARNIVLPEGATVEQLVRALMAIGSTPRDIIAILQNIRASGSLEADLEVI
jgi:flagellar P-ring protein precursor FlgI